MASKFIPVYAVFIVLAFNIRNTKTDEFRLLVLMPSPNVLPFSISRIGAAVPIAVDKVNADNYLLPGHNLTYDLVDTFCQGTYGLGRTVQMMGMHNYSAFIGPLCSDVCRHTARLAVFHNLPTFSALCSDNEMLDKTVFTTLLRTFAPQVKFGRLFASVCDHFQWGRVSMITDEYLVWNIPMQGIKAALQNANITVASYFEGSLAAQDMGVLLREAAAISRIIVLAGFGQHIRQMMIIAHQQGLINGEYAFFCIYHYQDVIAFGNFDWDQSSNQTENEIAKAAYEALMFLSAFVPSTKGYTDFEDKVRELSLSMYNFEYGDHKVSVLAGLVHDAIYLYAVALNETINEGGDPYDGLTIAKRMYNRENLPGVLQVTIDSNGDVDANYMMLDMQYTGNGTYELVTVGKYYGAEKVYIPEAIGVRWPGGATTPPLDTPTCGFQGELCIAKEPLSAVSIMGIVVAVFLMVVSVAVVIFYRRYSIQKALSDMSWKINLSDIIMGDGRERETFSSRISMVSSAKSIKSGILDEQVFTSTGMYNGARHAIKFLDQKRIILTKKILMDLKQLRDIHHTNLTRFVGACVDPPECCLVTEYCQKGSLQDILENDSIQLDWMFRFSLIFDIVKGMLYIHNSFLKTHGNLKSSNCVVDSRFVLKITDFGLQEFRTATVYINTAESHADYNNLLWRAPELLDATSSCRGTQAGDVYSFGIILQEIVTRSGPFVSNEDDFERQILSPKEIVERVYRKLKPSFRPQVDSNECPGDLTQLMEQCWEDEATNRPSFQRIKIIVKKMNSSFGNSENIMDNLLSRMEQYANNLEGVVLERTAQLAEEKKRSEELLHQLLPKTVADQLKRGEMVEAETFDCVTIFFSDIVGFTAMCSVSTPMQVVTFLNDLYTSFDAVIDNFDVYKIETIGDAYMVVSGLPVRNGHFHAREISKMALTLLKTISSLKIRHRPDDQLKLRIGVHSGPVVAGVVGLKMPRYCLFGDTVNTTSRMESNGFPMKIHLSPATKELLDRIGGFNVSVRGEVEMKGKGKVTTFWLNNNNS
ncbi:atrial natriuretic peptide receptor 2-like [Glandiceps talaboti]